MGLRLKMKRRLCLSSGYEAACATQIIRGSVRADSLAHGDC